jgi:murein DD-endopeptidase MepM/ murein hydrolase activator NlpD
MNTIVVDSSGTAAVVDNDRTSLSRDNESYFYGAAALIVLASLLSLVLSGDIPSIRWDALRTLRRPNAHAAHRSLLWDEWAGASAMASLALPRTLVRVLPSDAGLPRVQEVVVRKGETLRDVWKIYTAFPEGCNEALKELGRLKQAHSLAAMRDVDVIASERLTLRIADKDIIELKRTLKDGIVLRLEGNSLQGYQGEVIHPKISEDVRVVSGAIDTTLSEAARRANLPYQIVDQFVDLFGTRVDFRKDLRRGDTFALKYTMRISDVQGELPPGAIQAVSLSIGGKIYAAIRHQQSDGSFVYIDERGRPLGDYFLKYPLSFSRISSVYSDSRMHPVLKVSRPHYGVDFAAPTGTPVRSVGDGVIEEIGYKGSAGNMVKIAHNTTYATAYLHLHSIGSKLKVGSRVHRGQVIGTVGSTGLASGPHLHYSLYKDGKDVDPLKESLTIVTPRKDRIDPKLLKVTLAELGSFHSQYLMKANISGDSGGKRNVMKTIIARHENVASEAALSLNESAQTETHGKREQRKNSLELILNDPRLRLRSDDAGRCDSLNVFACGR